MAAAAETMVESSDAGGARVKRAFSMAECVWRTPARWPGGPRASEMGGGAVDDAERGRESSCGAERSASCAKKLAAAVKGAESA